MRYEGFGPEKIAVIVETLTDNKNRTASSIRTIFQKFDGSLGTSGVASHLFKQVGVLRVDSSKFVEDKLFEMAVDSGAKDCIMHKDFCEIITDKNEFYNVKTNLEKNINNFLSFQIEWKPLTLKQINSEKIQYINEFINMLEDNDDVQFVFSNHVTN